MAVAFAVVVVVNLLRSVIVVLAGPARPGYVFLTGTAVAILVGFPLLYLLVHRPFSKQFGRTKRASDGLAASEEKYRFLMDTLQEGVCMVDLQQRTVFANRRMADMIGYSPDEMLGRDLSEFLDGEEARVSQALFSEISQQTAVPPGRVEGRVRRKDGSYARVMLSYAVLRGQTGAFSGVLAVLSDMTDHWAAEEEVQRQRTLLRRVLDALPVGVRVIGLDGTVQSRNPAVAKIWGGFPDTDLTGTAGCKGWRGDAGQPLAVEDWAWARALRTGEETHDELIEIERFDGARRTILNSGLPIRDSEGAIVGAIAVDADVTTEREALLKFDRLFQSNPAPMAVSDAATRTFTDINDAFEKMSGYSREEVLGKTAAELDISLNPQLHTRATRALVDAGDLSNLEMSVRRKDGTSRIGLFSGEIIKNAGNTYLLTVMLDVTEIRRTEQELRDSREQLRALAQRFQQIRDEERASIAREVHDELGQVLARVRMSITLAAEEFMERGELCGQLRELDGLVANAMDSIRRMVGQLRLVVLEELGLAAAIEFQVDEFQKRTHIDTDVRISMGDEPLDPQVARVMYRICQEALTNVAIHSQAGHTEVVLKREAAYLELTVKDDGCGVDPGESERPRSLGIAGMRERALAVGGEVTVTGSSEGTVVRAWLPLVRAEGENVS